MAVGRQNGQRRIMANKTEHPNRARLRGHGFFNGLAALVRERFARSVLYFVVFLVTAANTFNIGADLGSMAASARLLVPLPTRGRAP